MSTTRNLRSTANNDNDENEFANTVVSKYNPKSKKNPNPQTSNSSSIKTHLSRHGELTKWMNMTIQPVFYF